MELDGLAGGDVGVRDGILGEEAGDGLQVVERDDAAGAADAHHHRIVLLLIDAEAGGDGLELERRDFVGIEVGPGIEQRIVKSHGFSFGSGCRMGCIIANESTANREQRTGRPCGAAEGLCAFGSPCTANTRTENGKLNGVQQRPRKWHMLRATKTPTMRRRPGAQPARPRPPRLRFSFKDTLQSTPRAPGSIDRAGAGVVW